MVTAEEMWKASGIKGKYNAWAFGEDADKLADLVKTGIKTATCSAYCFYELENEPLPMVGEYSVILDSSENAVCIIRTTTVYTTAFNQVSKEHAFKEGEGNRTLDYWRNVHQAFFTDELRNINRDFDNGMELVCEEFEVVYGGKKNGINLA